MANRYNRCNRRKYSLKVHIVLVTKYRIIPFSSIFIVCFHKQIHKTTPCQNTFILCSSLFSGGLGMSLWCFPIFEPKNNGRQRNQSPPTRSALSIFSFSSELAILHTSPLSAHTGTPGYQHHPPESSLLPPHKEAPLMCPASASPLPEQV